MNDKIDWTKGVVAIIGKDGRAKGAGFVVSPDGLILTCAHVLAQAGWPYENWDKPVRVRFKASGQATRRSAGALVQAGNFRSQVHGDIALLSLTGALPEGVLALELAAAAGTAGHTVYTWGYPSWQDGLAGGGTVAELVPGDHYEKLQFTSSDTTRGYSGGPVWDAAMQRVTGMVLKGSKADELGRLAYTTLAAPAEALVDVCAGRLSLAPEAERYPVTSDAAMPDISIGPALVSLCAISAGSCSASRMLARNVASSVTRSLASSRRPQPAFITASATRPRVATRPSDCKR